MNQNPDINDGHSWSVMEEAIGLMGAVVILGLALGLWGFKEWRQAKARFERSEMALNKLGEVSKINYIIRRMSEGELEEAKEMLNAKLMEDLSELRSSLPNTDGDTREFVAGLCDKIVQTEKAHPEYYLSPWPSSPRYLSKEWEKFELGSFGAAAAQ